MQATIDYNGITVDIDYDPDDFSINSATVEQCNNFHEMLSDFHLNALQEALVLAVEEGKYN